MASIYTTLILKTLLQTHIFSSGQQRDFEIHDYHKIICYPKVCRVVEKSH